MLRGVEVSSAWTEPQIIFPAPHAGARVVVVVVAVLVVVVATVVVVVATVVVVPAPVVVVTALVVVVVDAVSVVVEVTEVVVVVVGAIILIFNEPVQPFVSVQSMCPNPPPAEPGAANVAVSQGNPQPTDPHPNAPPHEAGALPCPPPRA